jgi:uncharacterized protein (TIGR00730 family)
MSTVEKPHPEHGAPEKSGTLNSSDRDASFQVIQRAVLGLWEVVSDLTSIQHPKRKRYSVTIFGSSRLRADSPLYDGVRHLAQELTVMGCDIVTGGGPGLMQAANEGSVSADPTNQAQSIGIRMDLELEQHTNPFVEKVYQHRTFFSRLHQFVLLSDAFVVVPGGIGTTLETLMIWQLLQARKLHNTPLILVGEMWFDLVAWAEKYMVKTTPQLAHPKDMQIPRCVETFDDAVALLRESHAVWERQSES